MTSRDSGALLVESASPKRSTIQAEKERKLTRLKWAAGITLVVITIVVIIVLAVTLGESDNKKKKPDDIDWEKRFLEVPSAATAKLNSFHFSSEVHVAGTQQNFEYAVDIQQQLIDMGYTADIVEYAGIYLSYYNGSSLAQLNTSDPSQVLTQFSLSEEYIPEDATANTSLRHQAWLGYAHSGDVNGYLVYVNYGDIKDFNVLINQLQFDSQNQSVIAIVRYGALLRGIKALNAADFDFKAVILFSDPDDYAPDPDRVFPKGPWLPPSGFQRGSASFINRCFGNPSPERALSMCGRPVEEVIPSIPIIPLSYSNAQKLMSQMVGPSVEDSPLTEAWQGGMNFSYRLGSVNASDGVLVNVQASNGFGPTTIYNALGYIRGTKYPQESILFGAHRDAWVYGASDPISGTTSILEIARAFSALIADGWQPLRSIFFASWDGEEFGLIGSTEYGEAEHAFIAAEMVAYFNQDVAVSGPNFGISADPLLEYMAKRAMSKVEQPYRSGDSDDSVYDVWAANRQNLNTGMLGSGSDYTVFVHEFGIAAVDLGFSGQGGTYHSVYDSYTVMSEFVDPDFEFARGSAQVIGLMGFEMVNNDLLPFNTTNLYVRLKQFATESIPALAEEYNCNVNTDLADMLLGSVEDFGAVAINFDAAVSMLSANDKNYEEIVIEYNHGMRTLGTKFLYEDGLPTRKIFKNLIVAAALDNGYASQVLPYIAYGIKFECTEEMLQEGYAATSGVITNAADYLSEYVN